jgi:5-methylcytosine-specific restriction endonuclease McrA
MLEELLDVYLEKKDPVKKAERTYLRQVRPSTAVKTMPAKVKHQVNLRDRGKCQAPGCENDRYVEIHHIVPRAQGGPHTLENLTTLCSAHHRITHLEDHNARATSSAPKRTPKPVCSVGTWARPPSFSMAERSTCT